MRIPSRTLAIALCSAAIVAAILAPISTSSTTDQRRILNLESTVRQMRVALSCYTSATGVSAYKAADGKLWLAPTRSVHSKRLYIALVNANCMARFTPTMLGWHY